MIDSSRLCTFERAYPLGVMAQCDASRLNPSKNCFCEYWRQSIDVASKLWNPATCITKVATTSGIKHIISRTLERSETYLLRCLGFLIQDHYLV